MSNFLSLLSRINKWPGGKGCTLELCFRGSTLVQICGCFLLKKTEKG